MIEEIPVEKQCSFCRRRLIGYAEDLTDKNRGEGIHFIKDIPQVKGFYPVCRKHRSRLRDRFERVYEKKKDEVLSQYAKKLEEKTTLKQKADDKAIIRLFNSGKTRKEIAKLFQMPYGTIKNRILLYKERGWISYSSKDEREDNEETQERAE